MKLAVVYYQERKNLNTEEVLQKMKGQFEKEKWKLSRLYIDKINEFDRLMDIITDELNYVDVLFLYSKYNINDDFYRNLLFQSARIENVLIKEYLE